MTNEKFKENLLKYKYYLKPALYTVLAENADVFSDDTKKEIVEKLVEADQQMQELHDYQEKRNGILRTGLETIESIYSKAKIRFQSVVNKNRKSDVAEADRLISNI